MADAADAQARDVRRAARREGKDLWSRLASIAYVGGDD